MVLPEAPRPAGGELTQLPDPLFDDWLRRFNGQEMRRPVNEEYLPVPRYLEWHRAEVFRGGERPYR